MWRQHGHRGDNGVIGAGRDWVPMKSPTNLDFSSDWQRAPLQAKLGQEGREVNSIGPSGNDLTICAVTNDDAAEMDFRINSNDWRRGDCGASAESGALRAAARWPGWRSAGRGNVILLLSLPPHLLPRSTQSPAGQKPKPTPWGAALGNLLTTLRKQRVALRPLVIAFATSERTK